MKIDFVGPSYEARSLNADAQRSVNCYLELDNASPRAPIALYGTPGMVLRFTLPSAPIRGGIAMGAYAYVVGGSTVYSVEAIYGTTTPTYDTPVALGTIATSEGPVSLAQNGVEVIVVDGVLGWLATPTTLTQITDDGFPNGVTRATSQDGYFIVCGDGTEQFYINETPRNGAQWSGTDFASAEGAPDATITCISYQRELWLFGNESGEMWLDTGNPDFPFERSGNTFMERGCGAAASIAGMDNTVYWLGSSKDGAGIVFKAQGYTPVRISTHAVEKAIASYGDVSDAQAFCYEMEGHSFYALTFPTADHTWVYDASTGQWHEWLWRNPVDNTLHRHRANCHIFFNNEHLVGDWESGDVYALDFGTYTDNTTPILRLRTTQTLSDGGARLFFEELFVDMETGVGLATGQGEDPLLMLEYSNDGGHTWSRIKTAKIGRVGEYGKRVKFGPTGNGRDRLWRLTMTDPVKFAVFGANARVTKGV
jgi:hypothetical protein